VLPFNVLQLAHDVFTSTMKAVSEIQRLPTAQALSQLHQFFLGSAPRVPTRQWETSGSNRYR
jgi:hypothetical protein